MALDDQTRDQDDAQASPGIPAGSSASGHRARRFAPIGVVAAVVALAAVLFPWGSLGTSQQQSNAGSSSCVAKKCSSASGSRTAAGDSDDAKAEIQEWSDKIDSALANDPKYVGFGLDYVHGAVQVYYAGQLPPAVVQLRPEAQSNGVDIELVRVKYGTGELDAAAVKLEKALDAAGIASNETATGTPRGGTNAGLTIYVSDPSAALTSRVQSIAAATIPGIPVYVAKSEGKIYPD